MLADQLATAIAQAPLRSLEDLSRDLWKAFSAGMLNDDEAQALAEAIHTKRTRLRSGPQEASGATQTATKPQPRSWSYFPPKRSQRSPDRQRSLERRRTLAASGPMPPAMAAGYTTGEQAVLRIVADEVRDKGTCTLSIPEIAARAGVGVTKARMTLREASKQGHLTIEERRVPYRPNLPNVVRIISREWRAWINHRGAKRPSPGVSTASHGGGSTFVKATESKGLRKIQSGESLQSQGIAGRNASNARSITSL